MKDYNIVFTTEEKKNYLKKFNFRDRWKKI